MKVKNQMKMHLFIINIKKPRIDFGMIKVTFTTHIEIWYGMQEIIEKVPFKN